MADIEQTPQGSPKKRIFLNAFDMFTVGHLSFGQWRRPGDRSIDKRRDLTYWTDLAQLLEKGDITALFLADTFGQFDVYKGSAEPCIRTGAQFPMGDPAAVSDILWALLSMAMRLSFISQSQQWLPLPRTLLLLSQLRPHMKLPTQLPSDFLLWII